MHRSRGQQALRGDGIRWLQKPECARLRDKDRRPRALTPSGLTGTVAARPASLPPASGPTSRTEGAACPARDPQGPRPGRQLLGLEPRRRRRAPNGQARSRRADSGARCPRHGGRSELARPLPHLRPGPRTLMSTYPVPHHPRGLRRSGLSAEAALPPVRGLKWLRNKENPGSGERRSDWPGGGARRGNLRRRSPW